MFNIFSYIFGSTTEPVPTESNSVTANQDGQGPVDGNGVASAIVTPPAPDVTNNLDAQSAVANDSGDVALMDESWYVTPPPCFTGEDKLNEIKPKPKSEDAAARENALIEHPSIYIDFRLSQLAASQAKCTEESLSLQPASRLIKCGKTTKKSEPEEAAPAPEVVEEKPANTIVMPMVKPDDLNKKDEQVECTKPEDTLEKFVVINWNDEMDDDVDDEDDFDNLFGSKKVVESAGVMIEPKEQPTGSSAQPEEAESNLDMQSLEEEQADEDCTGCVLMNTFDEEEELENISPLDCEVELDVKEHQDDLNDLELTETVVAEDKLDRKKPLVHKQPIKPERQPGWQLKKRRSKRQSMLASSTTVGCKSSSIDNDSDVYGSSSASSSSDRASPMMLNERIGSRIVANLNQLTSGLATTTLPMPPRSCAINTEADRLNQSVSRKMESCSVMAARKRMSKGYMDRQNGCAKVANNHRRADRRKKMYTTPNGYSVNRKVHTSIH